MENNQHSKINITSCIKTLLLTMICLSNLAYAEDEWIELDGHIEQEVVIPKKQNLTQKNQKVQVDNNEKVIKKNNHIENKNDDFYEKKEKMKSEKHDVESESKPYNINDEIEITDFNSKNTKIIKQVNNDKTIYKQVDINENNEGWEEFETFTNDTNRPIVKENNVYKYEKKPKTNINISEKRYNEKKNNTMDIVDYDDLDKEEELINQLENEAASEVGESEEVLNEKAKIASINGNKLIEYPTNDINNKKEPIKYKKAEFNQWDFKKLNLLSYFMLITFSFVGLIKLITVMNKNRKDNYKYDYESITMKRVK